MSKQSHEVSKAKYKYAALIRKVADKYGVTIMDVMSRNREWAVMDARRDAYAELLTQGLTYDDIGAVFDRNARSVIDLLHSKRKRERTPHEHYLRSIAQRDEIERQGKVMLERGSKALARAIFATGKLHGPMPEASQCEAVEWSQSGKLDLIRIGLLK